MKAIQKRSESAFKSLDGQMESLSFFIWRGLQDEMKVEKLDSPGGT